MKTIDYLKVSMIFGLLFYLTTLSGCKLTENVTEAGSGTITDANPPKVSGGGTIPGAGGGGLCAGDNTVLESYNAGTTSVGVTELGIAFTADANSWLKKVNPRIWNANMASTTLLLTIRPKSGASANTPFGTATILNGGMAQSISIPAADPGAGGMSVTLDTPVQLSAGQQYWIAFQRVVAGTFNVRYRNANADNSINMYWDLTGYVDWEPEFAAYGCL